MSNPHSGDYTCASGAVFHWKREETPGVAGVLSGYFIAPRPSEADVAEVQKFLHTLVPEAGTVEFCRVLSGPTQTAVKQQSASVTDQLLGRASRN